MVSVGQFVETVHHHHRNRRRRSSRTLWSSQMTQSNLPSEAQILLPSSHVLGFFSSFFFFFNPVCPSVCSQIDKHSGGTVSEVERNCHQALKQYGTFLIAFILTTGALHCMCSKEVTEVHTVHCLTILRGRISLKRIARENFKGS